METAQSRSMDLTPKYSIPIGREKLSIQCRQWGNGQKFVNISTYKFGYGKHLPDILVPQGAYRFVAAMDEVISQLPMEEPKHPEGDESPLILATQIIVGDRHYNGQQYDFELSAWHEKGGEWHFNIRSVQTSEELKDKKQHVYFPFSAFPWLRKKMTIMLAEHDGTQGVDKMPIIPEWAKREKAETEKKEKPSESRPNENADESKALKLAASLDLGQNGQNRQLNIICDRGRTGQKTIEISMTIPKESSTIHVYLPQIRVPQEAYKFLGAMDGLIGQLPAVAPAIPDRNKSRQQSILASQMVKCEDGQDHDFKLSIMSHQKDGEWDVYIRSVQTSAKHNNQPHVYFPLWALPWLRQQISKILKESDLSKRINEMQAIPEWATRAALKIEQQDQQPNEEQEKVTEKKADDAEDRPCCKKSSGNRAIVPSS